LATFLVARLFFASLSGAAAAGAFFRTAITCPLFGFPKVRSGLLWTLVLERFDSPRSRTNRILQL
jgi:hypothetical protein